MSEEEINVAIAEACGWTHTKTIRNPNETAYGRHPIHTANVPWELPLPDYCNDLNAMHEAIRIFDYEDAERFADYLCDICEQSNRQKDNPEPWKFAVTNAAANLRAEAFLRALGKWSE